MRIYLPRLLAWAALLILAIGCAAMLASCASHHPAATVPVASEPIAAPVAPESNTTQTPTKVEQKRAIFGLFQHKSAASELETHSSRGVETHTNATQIPRKCKGCTFNVVAGDQNNAAKKATLQGAGATTITTGKKSGPVVSADSGAAVHLATSGTGIAQAGTGNTATMPAPAPKPSFWQRFKWPALGLGTIAAIAAGVYLWPVLSPGFAWFIALFRRKKETDTTTA